MRGKGVLLFLLSLALLGDRVFAQSSPYYILLKDDYTDSPINGATVLITGAGLRLVSDSAGEVALPAEVVRRGVKLEITMIGYRKVTGSAQKLAVQHIIEMERDIKILEEVVITSSSPQQKVMDLQMGLDRMTALEAKKLPAILGETDILKALQLKPGVKSGGEGTAGFYVRGGSADQNLILLDGIPVYNPNHLMGLFSIFNNDAIEEVKLYKSAYPAQYGGRLSSILDISSRSGSMDSMMVSGGIGLLSSRLSVESPLKKGRSSFILSGRRTYFDIFTRAVNRANEDKPDQEPIPAYFFSDIHFRSDWKINDRNSAWATGYWGTDNFHSDSRDFAARFRWGNRAASLNWRSLLTSRAEVTGSVFYSGYQYQLGNGTDLNSLNLSSAIHTIGMKLTGRLLGSGPFSWRGGIDGMIHKLNIGDFKSSNDLGGFQAGEKASGNELGAFLNTEWDNGKRLAFGAGLRLSGFNAGDRWRVNPEPRLITRMNVGDHSALKLSYTRMYQYLHLASLSSASLPVDIWYPSTDKTLPQYADQVSAGWSEALHDNIFFFSLEAYYKWMHNQVEFRDGANLFGNPKLENDFVYGKGNAYGMEAYLEKKTGRTTGWIGYTLAWATREFEDINDGEPFKPRYDRRHDISVVVMHRFNKKFMLSGNWIYGSGAYTTVPVGRFILQDEVGIRTRSLIPVYTQRGNYQMAPVHRLDLSLTMALKSKRGKQEIIFSVYNAYSRRNPYYIQFKEVNNKDGYITAIEPTLVSLFPVLPGVSYNFKF